MRFTSVVVLVGPVIASPACRWAHGRGPFYAAIERRVGASWLHQLAFGHIYVGGHAGNKALAGIVDEQFQLDGFNVALRAAIDVALRGEVGFRSFRDDLALDGCAGGYDDAERVAQLD